MAQTEVHQDAADYNRVPTNWKGTDGLLCVFVEALIPVIPGDASGVKRPAVAIGRACATRIVHPYGVYPGALQ